MNVGGNIRRIREEKGISQVWLAEQVGISQPMLCQIERGTKNPSLQISVAIATTLGCNVNDFVGEKL